MTKSNPYKGSNYDDAGMPLGTTTADFDNGEEVRKHMVRDKPVESVNTVYDTGYEAAQLPDESPLDPDNFNSAVKDQVGIPGIDSDINKADMSIVDYSEVLEHGNVKKVSVGESYDDILEPVLKATNPPVSEEDKEDTAPEEDETPEQEEFNLEDYSFVEEKDDNDEAV